MEAHFHVSHDSDDEATCKEKKDDVDNPEIADFEKAISLTGYGKYNYLLLLTAMIGTIGHQCDLNGVSFLLPSAECDLNLTQRDKGLLNAVIYMGMISSAFMWGFISDTFGRRIPITVAYFLDAILNICSSFAPSFWVLLVVKFCTGFVCGQYLIVGTAINASKPSAISENETDLLVLRITLAAIDEDVQMLIPRFHNLQQKILSSKTLQEALGLAWIIIPQPWSWELFDGYIVYNSWRVYVLVCAMPSLLAAFLMTFFLESPKFLMAVGRNEQAIDVLRSVYRINTGRDAQTYPPNANGDLQRRRHMVSPYFIHPYNLKGTLQLSDIGLGYEDTRRPYVSNSMRATSCSFSLMTLPPPLTVSTHQHTPPHYLLATTRHLTSCHPSSSFPLLSDPSPRFNQTSPCCQP
uniref:Major facilitator superfamily (MFS) profile domain-containing protein n=1 Tax=Timema douglasi TaxID=61478 RepID=A0A7R8VHW1_TIMDO|nr:unnamed protein product [Timema douglasi]